MRQNTRLHQILPTRTPLVLSICLALLLPISWSLGQVEQYDLQKLIVKRTLDEEGKELVAIEDPGKPPDTYRAPVVEPSQQALTLPNVPAFDWSFGCSATSAAMIAGYYDHVGYPNMYTGPTNGGIIPMTNSVWGSVVIGGETRKQCPLSATRQGLDGRTIRGHVDDYWVRYGDPGPDPYIVNGWTQHAYGDCTADYMKTSQSAYGLSDGATMFYYYSDGSPYSGTEANNGSYGLKLFFESRGYTVQSCFSQYIHGYGGNTLGFTFSQYKQEIDAGRPVLIHVTGHSMVGYGYDDATNTVYLHDTWDYGDHSMTWGGSYAGLAMYAVDVYRLAPPPTANLLLNSGFELGTVNWLLSQSGGAAATFTAVTPGYSGLKAAKVSITTMGSNIDLKQMGFPLVSGGQYRLTFTAKSSMGRDMTVGVQKNTSPFTCYGLMGHRVNLTTAWATYSVLFNANGFTGTVTDARFMFWFATDAAAGEAYYIDDVALEKMATPVAGVPKVTTEPLSRTVAVGQTTTFSLTATGALPLSYQWQKNGRDIVGATSASYTTPPVTLTDNNTEYRCQVKNSLGVASSNHAVLTVITNLVINPGFEYGTANWSFYTDGVGSFTTVSPGAVGTKAGKVSVTTAGQNTQLAQVNIPLEANKAYRLKFRAYSNSGHDLGVGIQKNTSPYQSYGLLDFAVNLTTNWQAFSISFVTSGFTGTASDTRLKFWMGPYVTNGDQYFFDEVVLEKITVPSGTVPTIVAQPASDTVGIGRMAWFNVSAYGTPPLSFQWQRNGVNIPGATTASYQKSGVTMADNGASYRCRISNTYGSVTSGLAFLRVNTNLLENAGFEAGTAYWKLYKGGGAAASFTTVTPGAVGTRAAKVSITALPSGSTVNLKQLEFPLASGSQYRLTFKARSSTGRDMTVGVQKDVSPYTCYGLMGHRVNLTTAWATYSVLFNTNGFTGTVTDARFMFWFSTDASAGESYYIDGVLLEKVTTPVAGVPKVTTQPVSRTVAVGQRATFSVVATGAVVLQYQWQKNGRDILVNGRSATYQTPPVTLADNNAEYRCQVKNALGVASSNHATLRVTGLLAKEGEEISEETLPKEYSLLQNYPNPFNPVTTIQYTLPEQAHVLIRIYNPLGQEVATLVDEEQPAGYRSVTWDATDSPSGAYFCRMMAGGYTSIKKMMVIK